MRGVAGMDGIAGMGGAAVRSSPVVMCSPVMMCSPTTMSSRDKLKCSNPARRFQPQFSSGILEGHHQENFSATSVPSTSMPLPHVLVL